MPRTPRTSKTTTKQTDDEQHEDATRLNNPSAGLTDVNPIQLTSVQLSYVLNETNHRSVPDFIVVLVKNPTDPDSPRLNFILEIKGMEDEQDRAKEAGARKWVEAVNYTGRHRRWVYDVCKDILRSKVAEVVAVRM